jgi:hypothetical protein
MPQMFGILVSSLGFKSKNLDKLIYSSASEMSNQFDRTILQKVWDLAVLLRREK